MRKRGKKEKQATETGVTSNVDGISDSGKIWGADPDGKAGGNKTQQQQRGREKNIAGKKEGGGRKVKQKAAQDDK